MSTLYPLALGMGPGHVEFNWTTLCCLHSPATLARRPSSVVDQLRTSCSVWWESVFRYSRSTYGWHWLSEISPLADATPLESDRALNPNLKASVVGLGKNHFFIPLAFE